MGEEETRSHFCVENICAQRPLLFGCNIQSRSMGWIRVTSTSCDQQSTDTKLFDGNVITFFEIAVERANMLRYMMKESTHAGIVNILHTFMTEPANIKPLVFFLFQNSQLLSHLQAPLAYCLGFAELGKCCNCTRTLMHTKS